MEQRVQELVDFVGGSRSGYLQLLVAAADRRTFRRIVDCPSYPAPVKTAALSVAVGTLREALANPGIHAPTLMARLYYSTRSVEQRKKVGQYFTSQAAATYGVSLASLREADAVWDAGAGAGALAAAIIEARIAIRAYVGVENDPALALTTATVLQGMSAPESFVIWYANFLLITQRAILARSLHPPTVVLANPPFVRFHGLAGRTRLRASLRASLGIELSALSGSGTLFLSKAAELVSGRSNGNDEHALKARLVFFFPREMSGAAHAVRATRQLNVLHNWSQTEHQIPVARTGVDTEGSNSLALCFVFERGQGMSQPERRHSPLVRMDQCMRIQRGVSTGSNAFFVLTDEDVSIHRIPDRHLVKVLPTRIPVADREFRSVDWETLRSAGRECWLLALPDERLEYFEPSVRTYLRKGIERGVNKTPTAQKMKNWYALHLTAEPPDMFVTYLFREAPRFVLNTAKVWHLTNILGGRFSPKITGLGAQRAAVDALNRQAERWASAGLPGRQYRGGLRKIEPGEFGALPIDQDSWSALGIKVGDFRTYQAQVLDDVFVLGAG